MKKLTPAVINRALLGKLHAYPAARQSAMWENTSGRPRTFKDALTTQLKTIQSRRCAYCGTRLREESPARDHIAPRESHPRFTFITLNLVLACYHCNTECKGATDTVTLKHRTYRRCEFSIIHPHLDEPSHHVEFVGTLNKILIKVVAGSQKGRETARMFRLANVEMAKQRAKDALLDADLEHLPGNWRNGIEYAVNVPLRQKLRPPA